MPEIDVDALRVVAEGARLYWPSDENPGMDEVDWMDADWWRSFGLNRNHSAFAARFDPPTVLALLDRLAAAEGAVERVRALAAAWGPSYLGDRLLLTLDGSDR